MGISFKDDTLLQRLGRLGFDRVWRIESLSDLGVDRSQVGVEILEPFFKRDTMKRLARAHGRPDVIIARHVFEHSDDPRGFIDALWSLLAPSGYVVIEVPDCERALEAVDCTMIWEEHVCYFTRATFPMAAQRAGIDVVRFDAFPYPTENSLVVIGRKGRADPALPQAEGALDRERHRGSAYGRELPRRMRDLRDSIARLHATGHRIALFGAGHVACTFINLAGIAPCITMVVDDQPEKWGHFMPGSNLPIRSGEEWLASDIDICLLTLSPESEVRVKARYSAFERRGGRFMSIYQSHDEFVLRHRSMLL
jgi:hypothetical protein